MVIALEGDASVGNDLEILTMENFSPERDFARAKVKSAKPSIIP